MTNKRIIACLDVDKGRVVKGKNFQGIKDVANPAILAQEYSAAGVDELVFYDITASTEERDLFIDTIRELANVITVPFTVGGGIRTLEDMEQVFAAGVDKVSINSAAINNPQIIKEASNHFGSERIVFAMDVKQIGTGKWNVYSQGGKKDTGIDAIGWAKKAEELGAGEIVVNSIDGDGEKDGYSFELTKTIAEAVDIPVVASGGAGKMEHFKTILTSGKAAAALAASVFHYGEINIRELKKYLEEEMNA